MNRDDDFIEQLEDYLDTYEGVVPLPASVRDAVHARLPETRQVRGAGRPERMHRHGFPPLGARSMGHRHRRRARRAGRRRRTLST